MRTLPILALTALLALTACGGGGDDEPKTKASTDCELQTTPSGERVCIFHSSKVSACIADTVTHVTCS